MRPAADEPAAMRKLRAEHQRRMLGNGLPALSVLLRAVPTMPATVIAVARRRAGLAHATCHELTAGVDEILSGRSRPRRGMPRSSRPASICTWPLIGWSMSIAKPWISSTC
jgi:hypothetical protein